MCRLCRIVMQVYTCHGGLLPPSHCYLHYICLLMLSLPNLPIPCYPSPSAPPPNRPHCVTFPSLCPCVFIVQHLLMSENMWCLVFCSCVSLLRMMVSRFIHIPAKDICFFMATQYSMVYMCHIFFIQSIIYGHLGLFQVFAVVNSASMNKCVHVSL